jgi:hypothetical protein
MTSGEVSEYMGLLDAYESVLDDCITLSQRYAGIPSPTSAHFFASVLFTSICSRAVSMAILLPSSKWAEKIVEHWDYASLAVLSRSLLEIRIAFYYLSVESCDRAEWECRWNLFNLHDCESRIHLFSEMAPESQDLDGFHEQSMELRERLQSNAFFSSLAASEQKKLIRGKNAFMFPLEEIAVNAGIELQQFRWLYKFLSSHVHGLPMSFYRMGRESERGRGVKSDVEEGYSCLCLSLSTSMLVRSRDEMQGLFEQYVKKQ